MARRLNTAGLIKGNQVVSDNSQSTKLKLVTEDLIENLSSEDLPEETNQAKEEPEDGKHTRNPELPSDQQHSDQAESGGVATGTGDTSIETTPDTEATPEPTGEATPATEGETVDHEQSGNDNVDSGNSENDRPATETLPTNGEPSNAGDIASGGTVETEPVVQQPTTEPIWDADAERRIDEKRFFKQLRELSDAIEEKKLLLEDAKEHQKLCKAEFNLATARLQAFSTKGVVYRKKPEPKKPEPAKPIEAPAAPAAATTATLSLGGQSVTVAVQPVNEEPVDLSWRDIPTSEVIQGIERLGKKKAELLIDTYPTLGDLEDLRGEASKAHKTFKDALPNGIGQSTTDQLEERMWQVMKPK